MNKALIIFISLMLVITAISGFYLETRDDDDSNDDTEDEYVAPIIIITEPRNRQTVGDIIDIRVNVIPEDPAHIIEYYLDDDLMESTTERSISWDTKEVENGNHDIEVILIVTGISVPAGYVHPHVDITVKVYNPPDEVEEENTPPIIEMNVPAGAIDGVYCGNIVITGEVDDAETEIENIEMRLDDEQWFDVPVSNGNWHQTLVPGDLTGEILVEVRAHDGEDYSEVLSQTVECDNTAPDIYIDYPHNGESISGTVTFEVIVDDDHEIDYIAFMMDDYELQNSTADSCQFDTREHDNGDYQLNIIASDMVGNVATADNDFTIRNNNPPTAVIDTPKDGSEFQEEETVLFNGGSSWDPEDDPLDYFWESDIDGVLSNQETFQTELSPGEHTITLTVEDIDNEKDQETVTITIIPHENQLPEITITSPDDGTLLSGEVMVEGTAGDPDGVITSIQYRIDDGDWTPVDVDEDWSFTLNTSSVEDGDHTLNVQVEDDEEGTAYDSIDITIDNTPPEVNITSPEEEYLRGTVNIEVEITEEGSGIGNIEFRIRDETVQSGIETSFKWDTTHEEDGPEYNIEVIVTDDAGNVNNATVKVLVDNTPPAIRNMDPEDGAFISGDQVITPDILENGSGTEYLIFEVNGEEVKNSTSSIFNWETDLYSDGYNDLGIIIYDKAGNSVHEIYSYFIDNTPPLVEITSPAEGSNIQGDGRIETDTNDPDSGSGVDTVKFFFNGLLQFTCEKYPYHFDFDSDDYTNGDYTVRAIATDKAGNFQQDDILITLGDVALPIITDPHTNYLSPYNVAGKERLIFDDYRAIPIVSSRVKHNGVMPSLNWNGAENPKSSLEISMPAGTDYAGYAGNIALSYWTSPDKTIVVDNYRHAVMMTSYANLMDYPIIIYDNSNPKISDEGLWKLNTIYANQIVTLGNTPYNDQGVTVFQESDIIAETINAAQFQGITLDYITVVNPDDTPAISNTGYLSAFSGVFASHYDGIILACSASSSDMNTKIHNTMDMMFDAGMNATHICIVGDHKSLPMISQGGTPSDNSYADTDGNRYTIEKSIGRVVAKELSNLSYYVDRIVNYEDYLALQIGTPPNRILDPFNWNNNALIYMGWLAEFAEDSENHCREYLWALGRFNTQDDSDKAHGGLGTTVMMADLAMSNYFIINADHGQPTGTMTWGSEHLPDMHPGITFGVSCSLGRVDGVNKQASVTYTMMEKGMNVYLAPTRTAYGSFVQTYPYQPIAAPGLCYLYLRYMIDNDYDSGVAYMHAKNDLINNGWGGNVDQTTTWQYQHFGDPGFNPYEPCHEGSLF